MKTNTAQFEVGMQVITLTAIVGSINHKPINVPAGTIGTVVRINNPGSLWELAVDFPGIANVGVEAKDLEVYQSLECAKLQTLYRKMPVTFDVATDVQLDYDSDSDSWAVFHICFRAERPTVFTKAIRDALMATWEQEGN